MIRDMIAGLLSLAALGGATFLGAIGIIEGESVVALYGLALGAGSAVGAIRATNGGDKRGDTYVVAERRQDGRADGNP